VAATMQAMSAAMLTPKLMLTGGAVSATVGAIKSFQILFPHYQRLSGKTREMLFPLTSLY